MQSLRDSGWQWLFCLQYMVSKAIQLSLLVSSHRKRRIWVNLEVFMAQVLTWHTSLPLTSIGSHWIARQAVPKKYWSWEWRKEVLSGQLVFTAPFIESLLIPTDLLSRRFYMWWIWTPFGHLLRSYIFSNLSDWYDILYIILIVYIFAILLWT